MRHRNMFRLTGQPGWMRFGCSPGYGGQGRMGFGRCRQFMQAGEPTETPAPDPKARIEFLKGQMGAMEQYMAAIKTEIESLEGANN